MSASLQLQPTNRGSTDLAPDVAGDQDTVLGWGDDGGVPAAACGPHQQQRREEQQQEQQQAAPYGGPPPPATAQLHLGGGGGAATLHGAAGPRRTLRTGLHQLALGTLQGPITGNARFWQAPASNLRPPMLLAK